MRLGLGCTLRDVQHQYAMLSQQFSLCHMHMRPGNHVLYSNAIDMYWRCAIRSAVHICAKLSPRSSSHRFDASVQNMEIYAPPRAAPLLDTSLKVWPCSGLQSAISECANLDQPGVRAECNDLGRVQSGHMGRRQRSTHSAQCGVQCGESYFLSPTHPAWHAVLMFRRPLSEAAQPRAPLHLEIPA